MNKENININQNFNNYSFIFPASILLLASLVYFILTKDYTLTILILFSPFLLLLTAKILYTPIFGFYFLFFANYFIMGVSRYLNVQQIGLSIDVSLLVIFFSLFFRQAITRDVDFSKLFNLGTLLKTIWLIYCILEILNPTALYEPWKKSIRGLAIYPLVVIMFTPVVLDNYKKIKIILVLLGLFSLTAVMKMAMQMFLGFDSYETAWLNAGAHFTHILRSGIRYFSFFTDAGNFGSNMGFILITYGIFAFNEKNLKYKIFYSICSMGGLWGLLGSGTRGAIAVPLAGLLLLIVLSKNVKTIIITFSVLTFIYFFFTATNIGQGNSYIRRMRTAFNPNEPSLVVRKENQKILAKYLKDKPYGEGLGLSGGESRKYAPDRLTTNIPNDSQYVKIWVETGRVGLTLNLLIQFFFIGYGLFLILFKIKTKEMKTLLTGISCGLFGLMVSAYGNAFFYQYPTLIISNFINSILIMGLYYDKKIVESKKCLL